MQTIKIINISLGIVMILLIINIFFPFSHFFGKAIETKVKSSFSCVFSDNAKLYDLYGEECCVMLQDERLCTRKDGELKYRCFTASHAQRFYFSTLNTIINCQNEGYDVKRSN